MRLTGYSQDLILLVQKLTLVSSFEKTLPFAKVASISVTFGKMYAVLLKFS